MDDGEVEISDHVFVPNLDSSTNIQTSVSVDSFLDELLRSAQTCTHTHTCNPPGPDAAHTHTCYHTHTQVIPPPENAPSDGKNSTSKPKRPTGNREAVRKYREKKKAHTAYLEEEVKKLRFMNQQLIRKVQRQAILESEILKLRGLLLDLRGKIDGELGVFPFQKQCNSSSTSLKEGDCEIPHSTGTMMEIQCEDDLSCFNPSTGSMERRCIPAIVDCKTNPDDARNAETCGLNSMETLVSSASQAE